MMQPHVLTFLFIVAVDPVQVRADETLSSPVGGYCRIGKYTPVEVTHSGAGDVLIEVDGALDVRLHAGAGTTSVVPVLTIGQPSGRVNVHSAGGTQAHTLPFRILSENEKLVGVIGNANANDVQFLFPDKQIIPIKLDPTRPLPGTRAAWDVLDAIVCDSGPIPGADDAATRALLGCGITLAIRSPQSPDDRWPWLHLSDWWVLQHDPVGPTTALSEAAYVPVPGWPPGRSIRAPVMLVGFGLLIVIGTWTALMVRKRFLRLGGVIVSALALCGIIRGCSQQLPVQHQAEGTVAFFSGGMLQHDFWEYRSPTRADGAVSCMCLLDTRQPRDRWSRVATRPMLRSAEQASRQRLALEMDATGEPQQWTARLQQGEKLAFVTRLVDPYPYTPPLTARISFHSTATDSPMQFLVREAYVAPGVRVIGQGYPRTDIEHGFAEVFLERDR